MFYLIYQLSWGKVIEYEALSPKHFITFSKKFNKYNNTGAWMLDPIYHILFCNCVFGVKTNSLLKMLLKSVNH